MSANFLHGVETIEVQTGPRPITGVKTAVIGLVGAAPIFDVDAADQQINKAVLILNPQDAAKYMGQNRDGFSIPSALDAIFAQGNGPIVLAINVLDPTVHFTSVASELDTFSAATDTLNLAHPGVASVVVKNVAGTVTYVLNTDYTLDAANGIITRLATGAITSGEQVSIAYNWADPSKVQTSDIIGMVDASGNRTGMQALLNCYQLFGYYPKIIIAPGYSTLAAVVTAMDTIAASCRAMWIADAPAGTTVQQAITGRGPSGAINFDISSARGILAYPEMEVYDETSNSNVLEPYSPFVAGAMAANDVEKGYWWSPSNREIKGIVGTERTLTAMINDPTSETNQLNAVGIVVVFNSFGTGFRIWGNRTAAYPSSTAPTVFIPVRRTADVIEESIEYFSAQFMDYPINQALIDSIVESVNRFGRSLVGKGALIDFKCWYDPAANPDTEVSAGHLTFNYNFMPPPPAERITFESYVDITMLSSLGTGNQ